MKVLAIAYACNPYQGSEEGVGWGWVQAIAARHDVDVITAAYHEPDIARATAENPSARHNVRFHFVPERRWHYRPSRPWKFIENTCFKPLMNLAYVGWQRDAYRLALRLHQQVGFDLVHLITYVGFRFPGQFWRMDIPLVWGPIGGLENTPWRFLPTLGLRGSLYYAGRNIVNSLQKRFLPGPKRSFAKAGGGIIAATEGIRREILRWYGQPSEIICEIGPPTTIASTSCQRGPGETLRLIWSGQHTPGKALPLLLKALALLDRRVDWQLTILGTGSCTGGWKRLGHRLGIADRCDWPGWLARDQAMQRMAQAHVCAITSMKDLTSTVLVEALAAGLPVICPDHCGFSNVVTPDCGIKLPVRCPSQLVADLAAGIEQLAADEPRRQRLAAGALRRAQDFSWPKKGEAIEKIYQSVLGARQMPAGRNGALQQTSDRP